MREPNPRMKDEALTLPMLSSIRLSAFHDDESDWRRRDVLWRTLTAVVQAMMMQAASRSEIPHTATVTSSSSLRIADQHDLNTAHRIAYLIAPFLIDDASTIRIVISPSGSRYGDSPCNRQPCCRLHCIGPSMPSTSSRDDSDIAAWADFITKAPLQRRPCLHNDEEGYVALEKIFGHRRALTEQLFDGSSITTTPMLQLAAWITPTITMEPPSASPHVVAPALNSFRAVCCPLLLLCHGGCCGEAFDETASSNNPFASKLFDWLPLLAAPFSVRVDNNVDQLTCPLFMAISEATSASERLSTLSSWLLKGDGDQSALTTSPHLLHRLLLFLERELILGYAMRFEEHPIDSSRCVAAVLGYECLFLSSRQRTTTTVLDIIQSLRPHLPPELQPSQPLGSPQSLNTPASAPASRRPLCGSSVLHDAIRTQNHHAVEALIAFAIDVTFGMSLYGVHSSSISSAATSETSTCLLRRADCDSANASLSPCTCFIDDILFLRNERQEVIFHTALSCEAFNNGSAVHFFESLVKALQRVRSEIVDVLNVLRVGGKGGDGAAAVNLQSRHSRVNDDVDRPSCALRFRLVRLLLTWQTMMNKLAAALVAEDASGCTPMVLFCRAPYPSSGVSSDATRSERIVALTKAVVSLVTLAHEEPSRTVAAGRHANSTAWCSGWDVVTVLAVRFQSDLHNSEWLRSALLAPEATGMEGASQPRGAPAVDAPVCMFTRKWFRLPGGPGSTAPSVWPAVRAHVDPPHAATSAHQHSGDDSSGPSLHICCRRDDAFLALVLLRAATFCCNSPASVLRMMVSERNRLGATALWVAAAHGSSECCRVLLAFGARTNTRIMRRLVAHPAGDGDGTDQPFGMTAIEVAVRRGQRCVVRQLLEAGADVTPGLCQLAARFDNDGLHTASSGSLGRRSPTMIATLLKYQSELAVDAVADELIHHSDVSSDVVQRGIVATAAPLRTQYLVVVMWICSLYVAVVILLPNLLW